MKRSGALALLSICLAATPVLAQDTPAPANGEAGRYSMTPAPNGFLRLDTKTGAVSLCTVKENRVTCNSSADERAALETEIARLSKKNAELEKKLADASKSTGQRLRDALPSDAEMDKALSFAEQFMRRMMRIMREDEKPKDRI
ncbi:MAG: hypothetical protein AB7F96_08775 [Beijerinckiaceae bacterium]